VSESIPPAAAVQISRFLAVADQILPEVVEAVWIEGSIALGDFRRKSDVDLFVVTTRPTSESERRSLRISGRPPLQVAFGTWQEVATLGSCGLGAVTAVTLHRHGIAVRGLHPSTVVHDVDRATLAAAMRGNLEAYWVPWLERARRGLIDRVKTLHPWMIEWGVAGVPRQYITIIEGRIVSKTVAMQHVRERFDRPWHRILDEALRLRTGGAGRGYGSPLARRRDMLAFLEHAIERTRAVGR